MYVAHLTEGHHRSLTTAVREARRRAGAEDVDMNADAIANANANADAVFAHSNRYQVEIEDENEVETEIQSPGARRLQRGAVWNGRLPPLNHGHGTTASGPKGDVIGRPSSSSSSGSCDMLMTGTSMDLSGESCLVNLSRPSLASSSPVAAAFRKILASLSTAFHTITPPIPSSSSPGSSFPGPWPSSSPPAPAHGNRLFDEDNNYHSSSLLSVTNSPFLSITQTPVKPLVPFASGAFGVGRQDGNGEDKDNNARKPEPVNPVPYPKGNAAQHQQTTPTLPIQESRLD